MNHPQLIEIGSVQRTHGVNGELQVSWVNDFYPDEHTLESVFIEIDGIPIPFFIKSLRSKGGSSSLIKLEDVDSITAAEELAGSKVFAYIVAKSHQENDEIYIEDLIGFQLFDQRGVLLGSIIGYDDYAGNTVFTVQHLSGKEIIIPVTPELVSDVDEEKKQVFVEVPEGLIDLYIE